MKKKLSSLCSLILAGFTLCPDSYSQDSNNKEDDSLKDKNRNEIRNLMSALENYRKNDLDYYEKSIAEMALQRATQKVTDLLTPTTISTSLDSLESLEDFRYSTGKNVMIDAVKNSVRDWAIGNLLPIVEIKGKPVETFVEGLMVGMLEGSQSRNFKPRDSVVIYPNDLTLKPIRELPALRYGVDPFSLNPSAYVSFNARGREKVWTRSVYLRASKNYGDLSFDVLDNVVTRFGVHFDYKEFNRQSFAYTSFTLPQFTPLNVGLTSDIKGNWNASLSLIIPWGK